jgi:hypothetical protein
MGVKLGTCSPTLTEGYILRVSENRVLRKIFCLKTEKMAGGWRRLQIKEDEMGGACSTYGRDKCTEI